MAGTTTGLAVLPDVGELTYAGVTFNSLYKSKLDGKIVQDDARRTTKYVEWTLTVEGMVTLESGLTTTDATWQGLRQRLSQEGQELNYQGKGFGQLLVNNPNGVQDVSYGPVPTVLMFTPNGASRSAQITWNCVVRIPEVSDTAVLAAGPGGINAAGQVLQFSYEYALSYDEEGYAAIDMTGVLEVAATRKPGQRIVRTTVDAFRQTWLDIQFDLDFFKIGERRFTESADQRTCHWEYRVVQLSPAGLPVGAMKAGGQMTMRPLRPGGGQAGTPLTMPRWVCTLRCHYSIRAFFPRRTAFYSFMSLLWFRMWSSLNGLVPNLNANDQQALGRAQNLIKNAFQGVRFVRPTNDQTTTLFYQQLAFAQQNAAAAAGQALFGAAQANAPISLSTPILMDFGFDEGVYEDSKVMSFQASWVITTDFRAILAATGVWQYGPETGGGVGSYWSSSVRSVSGWRSELAAQINPAAEVIVDFGGGAAMTQPPVVT